MGLSQVPDAGESSLEMAAAEGATGPRKRSGTKDRIGIRDLWKAGHPNTWMAAPTE